MQADNAERNLWQWNCALYMAAGRTKNRIATSSAYTHIHVYMCVWLLFCVTCRLRCSLATCCCWCVLLIISCVAMTSYSSLPHQHCFLLPQDCYLCCLLQRLCSGFSTLFLCSCVYCACCVGVAACVHFCFQRLPLISCMVPQ